MKILFAAVAFWLAGLPPALADEVLNRIVASVDGDPITLHELEQYEASRRDGLNAAGVADRKEVLQALITEKLVLKEIANKGIKVRDQDIDFYIDRIKQQNKISEEQLKEALKQQGVEWPQYREQVRREIEKVQLLNREIRGRVNVTPEDVQRYYEKHQAEYRKPPRVQLRHIVLRLDPDAPEEVVDAVRERILAIRKRIVDDGEDFAAVAKQVSEDAAAGQGGDLGEVEPDKVLPEFQSSLEKLPEGKVSAPIRTAGGMHLLEVVKRVPEGATPVSEVSDAIKEKLYNEALDERYRRWLLEDIQKHHHVEIRL